MYITITQTDVPISERSLFNSTFIYNLNSSNAPPAFQKDSIVLRFFFLSLINCNCLRLTIIFQI